MSDNKPTDVRLATRSFSLLPQTMGEAMEIAKLIAESDFAPKGYAGKPANVLIAIQMGSDVGLKPMQSLQNIAVINGRPSIWGDAALALVQDAFERFHETVDGTGEARTATCIVKRKGWPDEIKRTFSVKDAKQAGLWGKQGPWQTYPDRMLQMRARGFAIRDAAPDRLLGLILAEEAEDYPNAITGEIVASEVVRSPLDALPEGLRDNIEKAFAALNLPQGMRVAKITEFLGEKDAVPEEAAERLLLWCKDEYSKRKTGQPMKRGPQNGKTVQPQTSASPADEMAGRGSVPSETSDPGPAGDDTVGGSSLPAETSDQEVLW